VSIYVLAWILFGIGVIAVAGIAFALTQDRDRPRGRHSSDDRVKPEDRPKEWQRLRFIAASTLILPIVLMSDATKATNPLQLLGKGLVIAGTISLLIWEVRSWRQISDPVDRRRALSSARWYLVPLAFQVLLMLHIWDNGAARIMAGIAMILIVAGPDVESWVRRRLRRRVGGTTS